MVVGGRGISCDDREHGESKITGVKHDKNKMRSRIRRRGTKDEARKNKNNNGNC